MLSNRPVLRAATGALAVAAGTLALASPALAADLAASASASAPGDDLIATTAVQATASASTALLPGGSAASCVAPSLGQLFAEAGDDRWYFPVPGGDFSDASGGWGLSPGARLVGTDEHGGGAGSALQLAPGAIAVSPPTCVDLDYPTARAWTRGGRGGGVAVLVTYADGGRIDRTKMAGRLRPSTGWTASDDVDVRPEVGGSTAGWRRVTFTLVNATNAAAQIDDLAVDPRMH